MQSVHHQSPYTQIKRNCSFALSSIFQPLINFFRNIGSSRIDKVIEQDANQKLSVVMSNYLDSKIETLFTEKISPLELAIRQNSQDQIYKLIEKGAFIEPEKFDLLKKEGSNIKLAQHYDLDIDNFVKMHLDVEDIPAANSSYNSLSTDTKNHIELHQHNLSASFQNNQNERVDFLEELFNCYKNRDLSSKFPREFIKESKELIVSKEISGESVKKIKSTLSVYNSTKNINQEEINKKISDFLGTMKFGNVGNKNESGKINQKILI